MPPFTPLIINGQSVSSSTGAQYEVKNPFSGEVVGLAASASSTDCKAAITSAYNAFKTWEQSTLATRRSILLRAADLVETDRYKDMIIQAVQEETAASHEMAMFNWVTSAGFLRSSAVLTRDLGGERFPSDRTPGVSVLTEKKPFGVIFTQSPWNAPIALTLRAVAVPILCGNTVVFRPSELSPRSCAIVCELFKEAGLPDGVFNFLSISSQDTPERTKEIIANSLVRKITFTGSDRVGRIIAMEAAKHLKPCVLELGGKAPAVVLNDANVQEAAKHILTGAMLHSGQICMSTERVIAQSGVAEDLFAEICALANKLKSTNKLGALFSENHAESVLSLVREAQKDGVQVLVGDVSRKGAVINPHVLLAEKPQIGQKFWERESFGPVLVVTVAESVDEAVNLANASDYSLTSSLWTSDLYLAQQVASRINAGYTNINGSTIHSEPTLGLIGLGGSSGYGRFGVDDFTYAKSIVIHPLGQKSVLFGSETKSCSKQGYLPILPEDQPPPRGRSIVNGRRVPTYILGWKLSREELTEIVPDKEEREASEGICSAIGRRWETSSVSKKYSKDNIYMRPDYMFSGMVHGDVFLAHSSSCKYTYPPQYIDDVMELYNIKTRPACSETKSGSKRCYPPILPEDQPPPRGRSIVNGRRVPTYLLGWKLSEEELIEMVPDEKERHCYVGIRSAIGRRWNSSSASEKYSKDNRYMRPDYMFSGMVHGDAFYAYSSSRKYTYPPQYIDDVMELYNIKTRPAWYRLG
ncbi:hypothetical protein VNI00_006212 [Paramarasmius palmivorus]|uniref:Aldehyde dehydrogenase domain-containing protein n=1 Tax=Paramarasmius palmivorus TaxID=297713 RepID=A0AAW0DA03_9AGAR